MPATDLPVAVSLATASLIAAVLTAVVLTAVVLTAVVPAALAARRGTEAGRTAAVAGRMAAVVVARGEVAARPVAAALAAAAAPLNPTPATKPADKATVASTVARPLHEVRLRRFDWRIVGTPCQVVELILARPPLSRRVITANLLQQMFLRQVGNLLISAAPSPYTGTPLDPRAYPRLHATRR
jgi:hypothetical protein